jgi:hypothetical protein
MDVSHPLTSRNSQHIQIEWQQSGNGCPKTALFGYLSINMHKKFTWETRHFASKWIHMFLSFFFLPYFLQGRDSSVGIATRYGLDGPGIESRWERDFSQPSRPAMGPTQPSVQWVPGLFSGVMRPGRGVDHPPSSSTRVKESVELYLYSPSGPSWPVVGRALPLLYFTFFLPQHLLGRAENPRSAWTGRGCKLALPERESHMSLQCYQAPYYLFVVEPSDRKHSSIILDRN